MSLTTKQNKARLAAKILFPVASALWLAFILSNSLRTGTQSSAQSSAVVRLVQKLAGIFFPDGFVANATGADYEKLHAVVRKLAHFTEYAVLGALLSWSYCAYTSARGWIALPLATTLLLPLLDEGLQLAVAGRAGTLSDVGIDMFGGAVGIAFALFIAWGIRRHIRKRRMSKKEKSQANAPLGVENKE